MTPAAYTEKVDKAPAQGWGLGVVLMSLRRLIIPLVLAAGLVLMLALGRWVVVWRAPLDLIARGGQAMPTTLQFVPKQSALVVSLLARPDRLADLWLHQASAGQRSQIKQELAWLEQLLLAPRGLSYQQDLQPWVGEEITAAVVSADLDQDPDTGLTPGYLVILTCRQSQTALASLELFWQNQALQGTTLSFSNQAGSRLIVASQTGLATTLVANRFLLVANHPEVLRQALVSAQASDTNLQFDHRYTTALQSLPTPRVGLVAINWAGLEAWRPGWAQPPGRLSRAHRDRPEVDWGLLSLALTRQGVMADLALTATPGRVLKPWSAQAAPDLQLLRYVPESLPIIAVGRDLQQLSQTLAPLLDLFPQEWRSGLGRGLPLDNYWGPGTMARIGAGVDQAYGLGLTLGDRSDGALLSQSSPGWQQTLAELAEQVQAQGWQRSSLAIQQTPVRAWNRLVAEPSAGGLGVRAEVAALTAELDGYQLLTGSAEAMSQSLRPASSPAEAPDWLGQVQSWRSPAAAYLHLDWPQIQAQLQVQVPPFRLWEVAARPLLHHLQQITLASYGQSNRLQTSRIFFRLTNASAP